MTSTTTGSGTTPLPHPEPLSLLHWYATQGWARRRARRNAAYRRVPILVVRHPELGFAAISEQSYGKYAEGCEVVERVES